MQRLADAVPAEDATHWWAAGQGAELTANWEAAAQAYEVGVAAPYHFLMRQGRAFRELGRVREE